MNIIVLYIVFTAIIALTYLVGGFFFPTNSSDSSVKQVFSNIFIGTIIIIFSYAIIKSCFTSFYIVTLLPIVYYLYRTDTINKITQFKHRFLFNLGLKEVLILFCLSLISFGYWAFYTIDLSDSSVKIAFYDYHFYSELARGLIKNGTESFFIRFYPIYIPKGTSLYHYFDLWLVAFLSSITGLNTFDVLMVIVYPFFYLLTLLGIASFVEKKQNNVYLQILLPFLITFILTLNVPSIINLNILRFSWILHPSNYMQLKLLCTYPFLLFVLHSFIDKKYFRAILCLLILASAYNTLMVSIIPSVFLLSVFLFVNKKKSESFILILSYLLCVVIYRLLIIVKIDTTSYEPVFFLKSIKTSAIILIEYVVKNLIAYIPVFIAFIIVFRKLKLNFIKENIEFFIFIITCLFSSLLFVSIFHGTCNYNQALYNLIPSILLILFVLILLNLNFNLRILSFYVIFFGLNIYTLFHEKLIYNNKYSKKYINLCVNQFIQNKHSSFLIYKKENIHWECNYNDLAQFTSRIIDIPSGINISIDFDTLITHKNLSPYGIWCVSNHLKVSNSSLLSYMAKNSIDYLFVSNKDILPFDVKTNFFIIAKDSISDEILLKRYRL